VSSSNIGQSLATIPSGVFVLASRQGEATSAILASFVQQTGFNPPSLVVAIGKDRPVFRRIEESGFFVLSVLGSDSKASLKRFWKGVPEGTDPFEGLDTRLSEMGIPIPNDAVAYLECRLRRTIDAGDHCLCLADVTDGGRIVPDAEPMVRIRKNGFEY